MCPECIVPGMLAPEPTDYGSAAGTVERPQPPAPALVANAVPGVVCNDPDCENGGEVPRAGCRACGLLVRLRFSWGAEPIRPDAPLVVGRAEKPLAGNLAKYANVSRRHAEIRNVEGDLVIIDLNSANGTFVNEKLISPQREFPLKDGDTVRFAADLSAKIDTSETQ